MVRHIHSVEEFNALMEESKSKPVLVDFFAVWCGPCKAIAPFVEMLEKKYPDVIFAKVDTDDLSQVARQQHISAMPTFKIYKNGKVVGEMLGANPEGLEKLVLSNR
eukprot:CAMPEP_0184695742 /NCGR_PEP_ID=MMETSP0313-20130426/3286_1 /TAXON_ID=2792 /ORGANISM="Porphyridium aerugineum, Strain SAG 1380-2" /LENGTH=105 /DNA_ID=CAMNT_0027154259 /DNA_START=149 /DNA_END=466 /DNA_ORIENTATION=-